MSAIKRLRAELTKARWDLAKARKAVMVVRARGGRTRANAVRLEEVVNLVRYYERKLQRLEDELRFEMEAEELLSKLNIGEKK